MNVISKRMNKDRVMRTKQIVLAVTLNVANLELQVNNRWSRFEFSCVDIFKIAQTCETFRALCEVAIRDIRKRAMTQFGFYKLNMSINEFIHDYMCSECGVIYCGTRVRKKYGGLCEACLQASMGHSCSIQ